MFGLRTSHWTWSAIVVVVLVFLVAMQMLRVNAPRSSIQGSEEVAFYTPKGPVVSGTITIPAGEFYLKRLDLNRRAKLAGTFRTSNLKNRVNAFVIEEKFFEDWKLAADVPTRTRTGNVPGGKIDIVLGPGIYLLLIDNRQSSEPQNIYADFLLG